MMRLCSYVVVHDTGFAPNPFGDFCTLAACTPNHTGVRLKQDYWLLGHSSVGLGNTLIYVMQVSEVLDFDEYYRDPRFGFKKPRKRGWQARCGDNMYFRDKRSQWAQDPAAVHHLDRQTIGKDTKYH